MIDCILNPGGCIDGVVSSWVAWFPFGMTGVIFTAGLICGTALGKWGVGAVIALALALKVSGKTDEAHEHVVGKDAAPVPPKPKKRPTIFGR